jgi:hypothetical protein
MRNIIRGFFVILLFLTEQSLAYDPVEGQVTATFGPYYSKTNFAGVNSGINSSYLGGVGLIAVGDINQKGSLEIGMFYNPRMFFREQGTQLIAEKTQVMHISMGYRRWINLYFSTSLAFYSSYSMGAREIVYSDFPVGLEIDTSARDITEYGLDWSIQGDLWSHDKLAVVFESRYSLSVTSKHDEKSDQYGFLLGLRYLVQDEKKVESRPARQ